MSKRLAVIGGGPKGAAIAAKAEALRLGGHHRPPPDVTIYERAPLGASWTGQHGYTDGEQPLCTLAERDLGFPYESNPYWGGGCAEAMFAQFSWQSFTVRAGGPVSYRDWVLTGRQPPLHRHFAAYLEDAILRSRANVIAEEVFAVDFDQSRSQWQVSSQDASARIRLEWYDGVVVTGSGRPLRALPNAAGNPRVMNGRDFWAGIPVMQRLLRLDPDPSVVIVGAGGTAAAIAYWFIREGITTLPITIVGREPTLYARHIGTFEDRLFSDDQAWGPLAPHVKDAFLGRATAGVVWDYVLRNLVRDNIAYKSYEVRGFRVNPGPHPVGVPPDLDAELDHPPDPALARARRWLTTMGHAIPATPGVAIAPPVAYLPATVFIDARGFDRWGFADEFLAASPLRPFFMPVNQDAILESIDSDLSITGNLSPGVPFPEGLHVPGIGSRQGPAATNLMALGWLADRILAKYC